jgi:hypothetical protein
MSQGTLTLFQEFSKSLADGTHDMDTNVFKLALITTIPTVADVSPALADYTEVVGTGYTAGGELLTTTWTVAAGVSDFKHTGGTITWTQNGAGPADIKAGLIYDTTSGVTGAAVCFIDFTTDGLTAISLIDGDVTWTPEAAESRIFSIS